MTKKLLPWAPGAILVLGAFFTVGVDGQRSMELRAPLDAKVPVELHGLKGRDLKVSEAEQKVAGMSSYVLRAYSPAGDKLDHIKSNFSVYVGYYAQQMRGRTIHSPKNCLPGSGWEALTSQPAVIATATGTVTVNRYILQREKQKALVLYWYQGRGRVESNEYAVKWHLLRDAATKRRSDEALVRIVVPVQTTEAAAYDLAARVAASLMPAVTEALPAA
jgi:EpsI family protein